MMQALFPLLSYCLILIKFSFLFFCLFYVYADVFVAIPLTAYNPMAAAAAAAAVVRGARICFFYIPHTTYAQETPQWLAYIALNLTLMKKIETLWNFTLICSVGSTPSRSAGFLGTSSPGPMADLYGTANQDATLSSYISAASPAPSTGFSHSLGVSQWHAVLLLLTKTKNY